jgi:hypothetical protein
MRLLGLAEQVRPREKRLQFELQPWRSVSSFDTATTHTRQFEHPPLYNMLWALVFNWESTIFRFICRAEVNISMDNHVQFQHRHILDYTTNRHCTTAYAHLHLRRKPRSTVWVAFHAAVNIATEMCVQFRRTTRQQVMQIPTQLWHWQHHPWLGTRGCRQESTMLQLVGPVPSIQFFDAIPITIQQDFVSPSEEWLTSCPDSWSRQHNQLPSVDVHPGLISLTAWAGVVWKELRAWHDLASIFCLLCIV